MQLPDNAFRELKEGESYEPIMSPKKVYPEVNMWSVTWGILMTMLFSAAAAYLGLKVGQVFEAAIPIAIIAVGVSTASKRSKALGENVIIQSIGACSGAVVAGAIFTLPAIYILQAKYPDMSVSFFKIFLSSLLGGIIGILFLLPFRKYFFRNRGRFIRLCRCHFRMVEREFHYTCSRLRGDTCREGEAGVQDKHRSGSVRSRIYCRTEICLYHNTRFACRLVGARAGNVAAVPRPGTQP